MAPPTPTAGCSTAPVPPEGGGLSSDAARQALALHGPNRLEVREGASPTARLLTRLRNPLLLVLLAASIASAATGDLANMLIIMAMVLGSVALDFVQEHRAVNAVAKLRESVALRATVLRDGQPREIPVTAVVPGDVVLLAAGERVPADGRVLEARDFFVNQGLLTGESYPVEKRPGGPAAGSTDLQEATGAVFLGSTVVTGSARMLVTATGCATALGDVAHSLRAEPPPTAFEVGMHRFGLLLTRLTLALVLFVLLVNLLLHRPLLDSFMFAISLAVGMTPELLPMVVTVTLSRGAIRLARQRVIVRHLPAIQNLGAMDVLCTDKTGTLTEAKVELAGCVDADGRESGRVLMLAHLNAAFESGLKSPLDDALLARGTDVGAWRKVDEVPFDFERRRVSVLLDRGDVRWLVVKGAPDDVLALCGRVERQDGRACAPVDAAQRQALRARCRDLERQGLRVLGVAWREVPADHLHADVRDESDLVFAGFASFIDPPKEGAGEALAALARSGVALKIVSGDSELVTQHLCQLLGIRITGVLTGREIAAMDEAALRASVRRANLFCRVNPAQKNRIILALKAHGLVVGYLGDGVNDAPPLRSADIGLTVDGAADVAREVADMVMLDHDLRVIHAGVLEGRRTFGNVMKYIMMGTSSNFGNMLSMAAASLFLPFLPLLPTQILLNNILYDISQSAIPLDRVDRQDLRRPGAWDMGFIQRYMWAFGLTSSVFDGLTFWVLLKVLDADAALFRSGWFVESLMTQVLVIFVIRTRQRPWASRPGAALAAATLAVTGVALALPWTPAGRFVQLVPLPASLLAWLAAMVIGYLATAEMAKRFFYRHLAPPRRRGAPARYAVLHGPHGDRHPTG